MVGAFAALAFFSNTAVAQVIIADGGVTGSWWNPNRGGEVFVVEVIDGGDTTFIGITLYSYDDEGNQLWIIGTAPVDADDTVVTVPMTQIEGPRWGPAYNPNDQVRTDFGTITVRFPNCSSALFQVRNNVNLADGDYQTQRFTKVVGVNCVNTAPPPEGSTLPPGKWESNGACLNVAPDGKTLTPVNSTCPNGAAAWVDISGFEVDANGKAQVDACRVDASCLVSTPVDPTAGFICLSDTPSAGAIEGVLTLSGAAGNGYQFIGADGAFCVGSWSAVPVD